MHIPFQKHINRGSINVERIVNTDKVTSASTQKHLDAYPFSNAFFYKYLPPLGPSSVTVIFGFCTVFGSDRIGIRFVYRSLRSSS